MPDLWRDRLTKLADALVSACAPALAPDEVKQDDRGRLMYASEDEASVMPIGRYNERRIRRVRRYRPLGLPWPVLRVPRTVVWLGLEEMFDFPGYTDKVWCTVRDEKLLPLVRPPMRMFARSYALKLDLSTA